MMYVCLLAVLTLSGLPASAPAVIRTSDVTCSCPLNYDPVCGSLPFSRFGLDIEGYARKEFGNECAAKCAGAEKITAGPCSWTLVGYTVNVDHVATVEYDSACICSNQQNYFCDESGGVHLNPDCARRCGGNAKQKYGACHVPHERLDVTYIDSCQCMDGYLCKCAPGGGFGLECTGVRKDASGSVSGAAYPNAQCAKLCGVTTTTNCEPPHDVFQF